MDNSIFDTLQVVQILDDDSNQFFNSQNTFEQIEQIEQNRYSPQIYQPNCLKISASTKPSLSINESLMKNSKSKIVRHSVSLRDFTNSQNYQSNDQLKLNNVELKKLNDNDKFTCQNCVHEQNGQCQICHGKSHLKANDRLIKFFEYILDFKLGNKQSYKQNQQKLANKRTTPNEHCSIFFSSINPKNSIEPNHVCQNRFSLDNDQVEFIPLNSKFQEFKNQKQIHYNYGCDKCNVDPIEGPRYHCNACQDFDLCESCLRQFGHLHELQKIEIKPKKKALQKINDFLKNQSMNNLRSSIKSNSIMHSMINNKTHKSWIC